MMSASVRVAFELPVDAVLGDQPTLMPATGFLIGTPASINASTPEQTLAMRGRTVRFHDLAAHAHGIREFVDRRDDRIDGAFRQRAMADFAAARAAGPAGFADAERREVVMQNKAFGRFAAGVAVEILSFIGRSESREADGLRFAPLKKRAAMRTRKQTRPRRQNWRICPSCFRHIESFCREC